MWKLHSTTTIMSNAMPDLDNRMERNQSLPMPDFADLDDAEHQNRALLEVSQQRGDRAGGATALRGLADIALRRRDFDSAEQLYRRILDFNESDGDRLGITSAFHQLGELAFRRHRLDEAEHWYRKSLEANESIGD